MLSGPTELSSIDKLLAAIEEAPAARPSQRSKPVGSPIRKAVAKKAADKKRRQEGRGEEGARREAGRREKAREEAAKLGVKAPIGCSWRAGSNQDRMATEYQELSGQGRQIAQGASPAMSPKARIISGWWSARSAPRRRARPSSTSLKRKASTALAGPALRRRSRSRSSQQMTLPRTLPRSLRDRAAGPSSEDDRGPRGPRDVFQRDRDRIVHSVAFRRLRHKTQVFVAPDGDHFRVRLTHSIEVAQIGRTMARALGLNEDLTGSAVPRPRPRPSAVRPWRRGSAVAEPGRCRRLRPQRAHAAARDVPRRTPIRRSTAEPQLGDAGGLAKHNGPVRRRVGDGGGQ